jgi:peptidyl-prolyl cis-trans isomerase D
MSMIQQIRNRQGLLIVMIGIGMLGFLVPYDAVMALFGQGGSRDVGEVNGVAISGAQYQMEVQERRRLGFSGDQLAEEVWSDLTSNIVLADDFDALGLTVSDEEYEEMLFGTAFSPYMNRAFYSNAETKGFWQQNFDAMLATDRGVSDFLAYKRLIVSKRVREKYDNLITSGIYSNSLEGKYDYVGANSKVNFNYVLKAFNAIDDSEVNVSDSDVRAYFKAHKGDSEYAQKAGRNITFARIPLQASPEDAQAIEAELNGVRTLWENTEDSDSTFVAQVNEAPFAPTVLRESDVELDVNEAAFFDSEPGAMVGPYRNKQSYKLARIMEFFSEPDSASCRHILLKANNPQDREEMDALMGRADSLKRVLRRGGSFDDLAERFSEDPGSKANGGFYDFFTRGRMVKPFENFCFENKPGSIGAVETSFGVHLIEVMEHTKPIERVKVAMIERAIEPSANTARESYSAASEFAIQATSREEFMQAAGDAGYTTNIAKDVDRGATSVSGLRSAAELVAWAYGAEEGEISNPILIDKNYVVGYLDRITEKGEPKFEYVEEQMRLGAIKEAKAELYAAQMTTGSLDEIAEAVGAKVSTASNVSLKFPTISGAGSQAEPEVVGMAFAIPVGNVSNPIVGNNGVWVIAPTSSTEAATKNDYLSEQTTLISRARGAATIRLSNAMLEAANIEDNRN